MYAEPQLQQENLCSKKWFVVHNAQAQPLGFTNNLNHNKKRCSLSSGHIWTRIILLTPIPFQSEPKENSVTQNSTSWLFYVVYTSQHVLIQMARSHFSSGTKSWMFVGETWALLLPQIPFHMKLMSLSHMQCHKGLVLLPKTFKILTKITIPALVYLL